MRCNKEDKQMPREEMNGASNICSPPSDRQMEQTRDGSVPRLLTWHACQGYQIVRGKDGSRAKTKTKKKRRDCVKSSWEGRT